MLRRLHTAFSELPSLMRLGLLIVLAGGTLDVLYHALPMQAAVIATAYLGQGAWSIHLVALIGMAITMGGVFRFSLAVSRIRHTRTKRSNTIEDEL